MAIVRTYDIESLPTPIMDEEVSLKNPEWYRKYISKRRRKEEKSQLNRDYIIGRLNLDYADYSRDTADFILDNLVRYSRTRKNLSIDGYKTLRKNWIMVQLNTTKSLDSEAFRIASEYLWNQGDRFNGTYINRVFDEQPPIAIPEKTTLRGLLKKAKSNFLSRFKKQLSLPF